MTTTAALAEFLRQEQRDAAMTIVRCDGFTREECLARAERHEMRAKRFGEIADRLVALGQPVHAIDRAIDALRAAIGEQPCA